MAVPNSEAVQWLSSGSTSAESRSGRVGPITLGAKQTGERSARNPHAAFDEAGAGNVAWPRWCDTRVQESLRALAKRYGINQKTVAKWKGRTSVADVPTGPKEPKSTVLSVEEEAVVVAFRKHTLLSLDDCLYALRPTIPHLTRSSLHRCLQRHGISRLPQVEGETSAKRKFMAYRIGYFHLDIAEVRTARASSTCWSQSTEPRSSPSPSCMRR